MFETLLQLLGYKSGQKLFILSCSYEFESLGQASGYWDLVWKLEPPTVQYYWKLSTGEWMMGDNGISMFFVGRNEKEVIDKAVEFLQECPQSME